MQLVTNLGIQPHDPEYHTQELFCEQIALLHPVATSKTHVTFLRSFVQVCQPGRASLDPDYPGADTPMAWKLLDDAIEGGAAGIFHTHPAGVTDFSETDLISQMGLAKAHGSRLIWHGVQAWGRKHSKWICMNMVGQKVFLYDLGTEVIDINNPVVNVWIPPTIREEHGVFKVF